MITLSQLERPALLPVDPANISLDGMGTITVEIELPS